MAMVNYLSRGHEEAHFTTVARIWIRKEGRDIGRSSNLSRICMNKGSDMREIIENNRDLDNGGGDIG